MVAQIGGLGPTKFTTSFYLSYAERVREKVGGRPHTVLTGVVLCTHILSITPWCFGAGCSLGSHTQTDGVCTVDVGRQEQVCPALLHGRECGCGVAGTPFPSPAVTEKNLCNQ